MIQIDIVTGNLFSNLLSKTDLKNYFLKGDCVLRPPALGPYRRSLNFGLQLVGLRPPQYCKCKLMNKAYYLFKIMVIQD